MVTPPSKAREREREREEEGRGREERGVGGEGGERGIEERNTQLV